MMGILTSEKNTQRMRITGYLTPEWSNESICFTPENETVKENESSTRYFVHELGGIAAVDLWEEQILKILELESRSTSSL